MHVENILRGSKNGGCADMCADMDLGNPHEQRGCADSADNWLETLPRARTRILDSCRDYLRYLRNPAFYAGHSTPISAQKSAQLLCTFCAVRRACLKSTPKLFHEWSAPAHIGSLVCMKKQRCHGKTETGRACRRDCLDGTTWCKYHKPETDKLVTKGAITRTPKVREIRECFTGRVTDAVGELKQGCEIFGFNKGQFSLLDILLVVLERTGPADVTICTWTASGEHSDGVRELMTAKEIQSIRWVVDHSFPARQPEATANLIARFGADAIRVTSTHAKFITVCNDRWNISIRSSMNLNTNRRFEQFEIADDPMLTGYLLTVVDEIFSSSLVGGAVDAVDKFFKDYDSSREVEMLRCVATSKGSGKRCQATAYAKTRFCWRHREELAVAREAASEFKERMDEFGLGSTAERVAWLEKVRRGEIGETKITPRGDVQELPASLSDRINATKVAEQLLKEAGKQGDSGNATSAVVFYTPDDGRNE